MENSEENESKGMKIITKERKKKFTENDNEEKTGLDWKPKRKKKAIICGHWRRK